MREVWGLGSRAFLSMIRVKATRGTDEGGDICIKTKGETLLFAETHDK